MLCGSMLQCHSLPSGATWAICGMSRVLSRGCIGRVIEARAHKRSITHEVFIFRRVLLFLSDIADLPIIFFVCNEMRIFFIRNLVINTFINHAVRSSCSESLNYSVLCVVFSVFVRQLRVSLMKHYT